MGRGATFTPSRQEARGFQPQCASSAASASFPGEEAGGALGAPGNGARSRLRVPRGRAVISPFSQEICEKRLAGGERWKTQGQEQACLDQRPRAQLQSETSLNPFKSVQESSPIPLEMIYTSVRISPNQRSSRSPFPIETVPESCYLPFLPLHSVEAVLDHIRDGPVNIFLTPEKILASSIYPGSSPPAP